MAYHVLSLLSLCAPIAVCLWLSPVFVRFMAPKRLKARLTPGKHDALFAAVFLLMLNRAWLGSRHIIFGSRIDDMLPGELPYLNAALAWSLVSIGFLAMILMGYRRRERP